MINYNQLLEKIARASNRSTDEISRLIEAKRAKLSGLISREGAAQIIASELGINFDKEKLKIGELSDSKKANVLGKIVKIFPVRSYKKETREGKVANLILADETGSIKTVLWDNNHIALIENSEIKEGDVVEINNSSVRNGELHLTGFSDIKKSLEVIENVKVQKETSDKNILEFNLGGSFRTRAFIVQAFEPRFFEVCPECGSKLIKDVDESRRCEKHGVVTGKKRALLNIVLDDGTENIRAVLFSEQINKLGFSDSDLELGFQDKKKEFLGKELIFSGNVRQNKLFNNLEFFISSIEEVDIDKLIEVLEKN